MASTLVPATVAEPLAPWFGGKKYLARRIIERVEAVEHRLYAEPFVGMGGVFLRRKARPKNEVINDLNRDIANLFRVLREHPAELSRQFDWTLSSRAEFERLIDTPGEVLTDVQRAARFAFLQNMTFGSIPANNATRRQIGPSRHRPAMLRSDRMRRRIAAAHKRLQGVHVECLDWSEFVSRYDRPFTLFYLDPPYWGHERDYGRGMFERDDFARMAELLSTIEARFILSLEDRPEVRDLFRGFDLESVTTRYSASTTSTRKAAELLISN